MKFLNFFFFSFISKDFEIRAIIVNNLSRDRKVDAYRIQPPKFTTRIHIENFYHGKTQRFAEYTRRLSGGMCGVASRAERIIFLWQA